MDADLLTELHPRLFHMAHHTAWPGIVAHGLLSTEALVDKFEITGDARAAILDQRRPSNVHIEHPLYGTAVIRDNKPMTDSALSKCLTDGTPADWNGTLNGLVFFWTRLERLTTLLGARAYRDSPHLILELDTAKLLAAHAGQVRLSPINSGSTVYKPSPRGSATFAPIEAFPYDEWRARRGNRRAAVVELTVAYQVPDVTDLVISAAVRQPDGTRVSVL